MKLSPLFKMKVDPSDWKRRDYPVKKPMVWVSDLRRTLLQTISLAVAAGQHVLLDVMVDDSANIDDETKMFQTAYSRHLKDVKDRANRYIRETESTWLKKAVYILLRFKQEIPLICAGNMFAIAHGALGSLSSLYES